MNEYIITALVVLDCILAIHPYFVFEKPWYGENRVWWSMLLFLPLVIFAAIFRVEWVSKAIMAFNTPSNKLNWKNIRW